jgi:hypothetical protein
METKQEQDICCPEFIPGTWDEKMIEWNDKPFISDKVFTLYYMPVNYGKAMRRLDEKVRGAQAIVPNWLCLSDHTSPWNMDLYLAVDKEVAGARNITITGKFFCKVYEGPYQEAGKWTKDFHSLVESRGMKMQKMYTWYTTCPKCAKKYGKNYVALMAQVE